MIERERADWVYWLTVGVLSLALVVIGTFMVVNIAIPELERAGVLAVGGSVAPSTVPEASPSILLDMGGATVPETADCSGCHATAGGAIGLASIPKMGHVLEGWSKCGSCHAPSRLVDTAPGHSGIHATECTVCHQAGDLPAPLSRPHRENQNQACLTCHGKTARLPSDMTHREESVCWLCHRLPTIEPPLPAHDTAPGEADCLTCHAAKGEAGALPNDHVERPASMCLACHEVALGMTPNGTPRIARWPVATSSP